MSTSINVECPECGTHIAVVVPETQQQPSVKEREHVEPDEMAMEILSWEEIENPDYPFPDPQPDSIVEEQVRVRVRVGDDEIPFVARYAPDWEYGVYIISGETDVGAKSKVAFDRDGEIYLSNRGKPWDENKSWTYLTREECQIRSDIAGLGDVIDDTRPDTSSSRYGILMEEREQPLIDENGELAENLVLKLVKGLRVLWAENPPTTR